MTIKQHELSSNNNATYPFILKLFYVVFIKKLEKHIYKMKQDTLKINSMFHKKQCLK
jgi:hypothetical protein